ncbi:NERD domain-containing protein [Pseudoalteromonas nigrifaciens]|uniref:nuclease-related domain-containing protein n=1 Tax=Pseudoalteromonas nigrifaciens TaxID=28109 RepID=UPI001787DA3E|nr:nuclease-related domain-containing protein [Pseudoalteromonas nigrifaciens]MBE0421343.1 NERD domain-containing protein [Pseudoalteromonas nigrifaciens]
MILKDRTPSNSTDPKIKAGVNQELNVAFYLRRTFKDMLDVYVFNDLKFEHNDEVAQIDHLILYPQGFILIESKSIAGEVSINKHDEWSRSYRGQWVGMPSPIQQVDMQIDILKAVLQSKDTELLPKLLGMQEGFGGRVWSGICAISSNAIINREHTNKIIEKRLIKSEFIGQKTAEIMKISKKGKSTVSLFSVDSRPKFNSKSMQKIAQYLLDSDLSKNKVSLLDEASNTSSNSSGIIKLTCKSCSNLEGLKPRSGRYGYFFKCPDCNVNTPLKNNCSQCGSANTRVSKRKEVFSLSCIECLRTYKYI